ncbi:hypothetical protein [Aureimonas sp. AU20]|uniref:hypothetical protein n=1 Tax=Aureimonas sp. AU20 TaxID=1349819 RepID=UPI00071EE87F|nr:hypothetical protein [Aureimonas sp. AU20]ALN73573.1 hypothetical protein M673_12675 [Aureimonas sp. AU20]
MYSEPSKYLPDQEINTIAQAFVTLARVINERSALDVSDVKVWFGQYLDLWPESVQRDLDDMHHAEREARRTTLASMMPSPQIVPAAAALSLASVLASARRPERNLTIDTEVKVAASLSNEELNELASYTLDELIEGLDHVR